MVLGDRSYRLREDIGVGNPCNFKGVNRTIERMTRRFFRNFYTLEEEHHED